VSWLATDVGGPGREDDSNDETLTQDARRVVRALTSTPHRFRLVDLFESEGSWRLIAEASGPSPPPRGTLSPREYMVALVAARGQPNKLIAHEVGLTVPTVTALLVRVTRKLGLRTRTDLVRLFLARSLTTEKLARATDVVRLEVDGRAYVVVPVSTMLPAMLTPCQCEIVRCLLHGSSNEEIAAHRKTSARTVANQLARVYRQLGVGSRYQLVALLLGAVAQGPRPPFGTEG
jgi:DNA-binding NarL/FixJ family response regulator